MHTQSLEPGMLRVFRAYAWLQLVSKIVIPLHLLRERAKSISVSVPVGAEAPELVRRVLPPDLATPSIFVALHLIALFALLYWPWLQRKLGRRTIPAAIIVSMIGIMLEQQLFMRRGIFWQLYPFMTVLLILTAWQYSFRHVIVFTLSALGLQIAAQLIYPVELTLPLPDGRSQAIPIYGFLFSLPLTFFLLGYVVNQLAVAQRKQRQALADANQKLVSHAATLEQLTISRERMRLSRELHDTLAHTLSAMAVQIEAVLTVSDGMPPKARTIIDQMQTETHSGLDETRRALAALRASPLEDFGLIAALRSLAEDFAQRNSLALSFEAPEDVDDLPQEVETGFYRVAQEALENVARHARARRLEIHLETTRNGTGSKGRRLRLCINDDGEGFSPAQAPDANRFGIVGMRERAELIGARLEIDSRQGKGTQLRLEWEQGA